MSKLKKTIIIVSNESKLLGATKVLLRIIEYLNSTQKYNILVICPTEGEFKAMLQQQKVATLSPECYRNYYLNIGQIASLTKRLLYRFYDNLKLFSYFFQLFKQYKNFIVYANTSVVRYIALPALLTRTKLLWHVHEYFNNKFKQKFHSMIIRWFADVIVVHSKFIISKMKLSKRAQQKVIFFRYHSIIEKKDYSQLQINHPDYDLIFAGKIGFQKGVFDLLKAINEVVKMKNDLKVNLCGVFIEKDKNILLEYISKNSLDCHITISGFVPDLNEHILNSKVVVLPTYRDYFPLLLLEAVILEKPVICTNVGDFSSIITHNKNGIFIDPGDVRQLTDAILAILDQENYGRFLAGAKQQKTELLLDISDYKNLEQAIDLLFIR